MAYPYNSGYCEAGDVQALFPNSGNLTQLSVERINAAIADMAVEMDGALRRFYLTPVSADADALLVLRSVNKYMAAGFIYQTFYVAEQPNKSQGKVWMDYGRALLDKVVPPRDKAGLQPHPMVRFLTAPRQNPTELPDFPDGAAATFNPDNDAQLHPDNDAFFKRSDRMPFQGGFE